MVQPLGGIGMQAGGYPIDLGANPDPAGGTRFRVWAPKVSQAKLHVVSGKAAGAYEMHQEVKGYFSLTVPGVSDGDRYFYQPGDGELRPDPVSRFQPDGVHESSQVVDPRLYGWLDEGWNGIPQQHYIIYEIHVGTFTREGTFEAVIPCLDYLVQLGVTAIELMPVSQFAGPRGWGYDGVGLFAPQNSYGGPDGLRQLVNACHRKGLAVVLDVVYNHLGPEGNHLGDFGHYFTERYHTPWGRALNFDGQHSDQVREYFIANALYWFEEFHMDALRLDAVDWILDNRATHFLQELAEQVKSYRERKNRQVFLFAENDTNDMRLVTPVQQGGYGIDAQWCDNFHHALRTLLTGETTGYYEDFGQFTQLVKAYSHGYVYTGEYSNYRLRSHGGPVGPGPTSQFVVFCQNHDQIGNRKCGDRLSTVQTLDRLLLAAGFVLLSPYLPLLFMGEEYGERAPFHYFVGFTDPELVASVFKGKQEEHASGICEGEIPNPAAEETFLESKIDVLKPKDGEQALLLEFYRLLLALRRQHPAFRVFDRSRMQVIGLNEQRVLVYLRQAAEGALVSIFSFSNHQENVACCVPAGSWKKVLDSSAQHWRGPGDMTPETLEVAGATGVSLTLNPNSVVIYASS
jgi:maltooligosyltrehalose trehalohydrolase